MLRKNGFRNEKRLPIGGRLAVAVLIGAMTLGVTMLRGPSVAIADPPSLVNKSPTEPFPQDQNLPGVTDLENKPNEVLEGFDFSYFPPDAMGVLVFRPSALLTDAGVNTDLSAVDKNLSETFADIDGFPGVSLSEMAQVTAELVGSKPPLPEYPEALTIGRVFIKTKQAHDWESSIRKWFPKVEVSNREDGKHFKLSEESYPQFGRLARFVVPDEQTIIITNRDGARGIPPAHQQIPRCLKDVDLKGNRESFLLLGMSLDPEQAEKSLGRFEGKPWFMLMALTDKNNYSLRFVSMSMRKDTNGYETVFKATCAEEKEAGRFESDARALVAATKMSASQLKAPTPAGDAFNANQIIPILDKLKIHREGIETNIALTLPFNFFSSYVDMVKEATK